MGAAGAEPEALGSPWRVVSSAFPVSMFASVGYFAGLCPVRTTLAVGGRGVRNHDRERTDRSDYEDGNFLPAKYPPILCLVRSYAGLRDKFAHHWRTKNGRKLHG